MKSIFDKTDISGHSIKNRIVRSATREALADEHGHITEPLFDLYKELAEGNIGMIITGMTTADANDRPERRMPGLYNELFIEENQRLTAIVHQHNTLILPQISLDRAGADPADLSLNEIETIRKAFLNTARIAQLSGYDGIQLHAAHGWLLSRFLSPAHNQRTDQYGGSPINRTKLLSEIVQCIRSESGSDFLITVKINCADFSYGGLEEDDSLIICQELAANGIDAIEVSGNNTSRTDIDTPEDEGYFFSFAKTLADTVDIPVILVGGHRSIENMNKLLNLSKITCLSLSRPFIKEPHLMKRWANGDTFPSQCTSCNSCYRIPGHRCKAVKLDRKQLRQNRKQQHHS